MADVSLYLRINTPKGVCYIFSNFRYPTVIDTDEATGWAKKVVPLHEDPHFLLTSAKRIDQFVKR